ncbi:hypothetical protein ACFQ0I_09965 [Mariniflexile aquimaris]|uniref:Lipocalin-like protein n=1 Tax=Mariniflexile aquimaris TaxID=881009 RepID=A0ABW3BU41_9FLAO
MIRNVFFVAVFLVSNHTLVSQEISKIEFEKTLKPNVYKAVFNYLSTGSEESKIQLDSIKEIERKIIVKALFGTWELFAVKCSDCIMKKDANKNLPIEFLKINKHSIIFYKGVEKKVYRKEKIKFDENLDYVKGITDFEFSDKTTWSFKTDLTNKYLMIYESGPVSGLIINYYKRIKK